MKTIKLPITLTAAVFGLAAVAAAQTLTVGQPAPPLKLGSWIKGQPITEFQPGKIYVIDLWATWCQPCRATIPLISKEAKALEGKATFIGIDIGETNTDKVKEFVDAEGDKMDYNVVMDQPGSSPGPGYVYLNWLKAAGLNGIPTVFVVGPDGKILFIGHPVDLDGDDVVNQIVSEKFDYESEALKQAKDTIAQMKKREESEARNKEADDRWKSTPLGSMATAVDDLVAGGQYDRALSLVDLASNMEGQDNIKDPKLWGSFEGFYILDTKGWKLPAGEKLSKGDTDHYYRYAKAFWSLAKNGSIYNINDLLAWPIVAPTWKLQHRESDLAIEVSLRAVEDSKGKNPQLIDTLAWAYYWHGDKAKAIDTENRAMIQGSAMRGDVHVFQQNLAIFEGKAGLSTYAD